MKAVVKARPEFGCNVMEVEKPTVGPSKALIRVRACAITGTDVDRYRWVGEYPQRMAGYLPLIMGSLVAGEIVELGKEVTGFQIGDRVAVGPLISCGKCFHCIDQRPNLCKDLKVIGGNVDGAMAEFTAVPAFNCCKLPDSLSFVGASELAELALTVHAVERTPVKPGDTVVILGAGPIGLLLVQLTQSVGAARSIILDLNSPRGRKRLEVAKKLGAETIVIDQEDDVKRIMEITGVSGADVVFEVSGAAKAAARALEVARSGGKINFIGLVHDLVPVSIEGVALRELELVGTRSHCLRNLHRALNLVASGKANLENIIDCILPLERAVEGFEMLMRQSPLVGVAVQP